LTWSASLTSTRATAAGVVSSERMRDPRRVPA
jgi:hypothetical protein